MTRLTLAAVIVFAVALVGCQQEAPLPVASDSSNPEGPFFGSEVPVGVLTPEYTTGSAMLTPEQVTQFFGIDEVTLSAMEGLDHVVIDCWTVDTMDYYWDLLHENYKFFGEEEIRHVILCKLNQGDWITADIGWFECRDFQPPLLPLNQYLIAMINDVVWEPVYEKNFWLMWVDVTSGGVGLPWGIPLDWVAGVDFNVNTANFKYDDVCGWKYPDMIIFGPHPPFPPPHPFPFSLPGEDGETRPWCFLINPWD
jgi:hypothetical protein